jgi:hypothetical protein
MSQAGLDQIPYYREYLEHILKPRVVRALEDIRARFAERAWDDLLARMADDQRSGASGDPEALQMLRTMLEQGLRLQLTGSISASFGPGEIGTAPAANGAGAEARAGDALEPGYSDNPLTRAVGGVRRIGR